MWEWQEPATGAERWGSEGVSLIALALFLIAALCSAAVGWAFYRDYSDASPLARGYFFALLWKRVASTAMFIAYLGLEWSPWVGVTCLLIAVASYDLVSGIFLAYWSPKGHSLKTDETIGGVVREEGRAVGYDFDTMERAETISTIKQGLSSLASKIAAEQSGTSDIHA